MALQSRYVPPIPKCSKDSARIIILGNGPSLRQTIAANGDLLRVAPTVAVNFMANAPEFEMLRPDYYVLADPHFFGGIEHENVANLWKRIAEVDWPMSLCVPAKMKSRAMSLLGYSKNVTVRKFNFVAVEGFGWFERWAYNCRLGMPRPRNVLIPSIMNVVWAGYKEIYIVGADHSWLETIRVTDENHVVSVQPHFYADSKKELVRSEKEYQGYHLHDILKSFYIAFRSYHTLEEYAKKKGVEIFNSTPGSYIDAFKRKPLQ